MKIDSYHGLAEYYDHLFPLTPPKLAFVRSLTGREARDVLDIGCATGSLALSLARDGHRVSGIDLDEAMIEIARNRASTEVTPPRFNVLDMRDVSRSFFSESLDTILCLGNTLPHLAGPEEMAVFLQEAFGLLRPGGTATFQIVTFRNFVGAELPAIERGLLRFTRRYEQLQGDRRIRFTTALSIPGTAAPVEEKALLYPLAREELHGMLRASGFAVPRDVAGYDSSPVNPSSPGFICSATKP